MEQTAKSRDARWEKRPIITPGDLEGLVIRTPSGSLVMGLQEIGMEVNYPELELFIEATEKLRQEETIRYKEDYLRVKAWLAD